VPINHAGCRLVGLSQQACDNVAFSAMVKELCSIGVLSLIEFVLDGQWRQVFKLQSNYVLLP
jgi:hypothetical protein